MSVVTNLILSYSLSDRDMLTEVNEYFVKHYYRPDCGFQDNDDNYGGNKYLERCTYVGAFNKLDLCHFVAYLRALKWEEPDKVQLFACQQQEDVYNERFHDTSPWWCEGTVGSGCPSSPSNLTT